jgi:hypothetical protein
MEAMQPYLPILRAFVLLQRRPATPAQRERLIQRVVPTVQFGTSEQEDARCGELLT